ncbi:TVP38/TMEM64 family protein [Alkalihalobacillus sp. LMS39]|uniref:TVP38/TMEM64 family protein n=1 Tax=Alkalihalobacillus sp. LMS39 TaxID=2924032 RepID=UPI001FB33206|nr:TVP38/TMEM64 family protein [Alkalihalobacillus sp. LMS39]UOE92649.1 TVP38/TMEM64 family protein [Alkalihalobacillus sp. LMS39]
MVKKITIAIMTIAIATSVYFFGQDIFVWLQMHAKQYILLTIILATLLALFPVIPYPLIGGVLGATFGPVLGSLLTWIGSSAASIIMFIVVRYGYQDWGNKMLKQYKPIHRVTVLFEKNAFITIFLTRLIPIIPSIIVNIYSALSKVRFINYAIASSLGKIPAMILFAAVGNSFVTNPQEMFFIILFYGAFLVIVIGCYQLWKRRIEIKV